MNTWKIEGDKLIIPLNLNSTEKSKSGKSILLASSHGFQQSGDINVSFNVTKKI